MEKQEYWKASDKHDRRKVDRYAKVSYYLAWVVLVICILSIVSLLVSSSNYRRAKEQKIIPQSDSLTPTQPINADILRNENVEVIIPKGALDREFTISFEYSPFEHLKTLSSIEPSLQFRAYDKNKQYITKLLKPFQVTYNYNSADLLNIKEDTIKFYRVDNVTDTVEEIPTALNKNHKTATAQMVYVTNYSLMGEIKDNVPPTTYINIDGKTEGRNRYQSPVTVELFAKDDDSGLGIEYTYYSLNDQEWSIYETPLDLKSKGRYELLYYSQDKGGNNEDLRSLEFEIN